MARRADRRDGPSTLLRSRGHRYTLITRADARDTLARAGSRDHAAALTTRRSRAATAVLDALATRPRLVTLTVTEKALLATSTPPVARLRALLREGDGRRRTCGRRPRPRCSPRLGTTVPRKGAGASPGIVGDGSAASLPVHDGRPRRPRPRRDWPSDRGHARCSRSSSPSRFRPWVIEDFDGPRPDVGRACSSASSAPHEALKLRLLNGTHSLLRLPRARDWARVTVADAWARAGAGRPRRERLAEPRISSPTLPRDPRGSTSAEVPRAGSHERWSNPGIDAPAGRRSRSTATPKLPARFAEPARLRRRRRRTRRAGSRSCSPPTTAADSDPRPVPARGRASSCTTARLALDS